MCQPAFFSPFLLCSLRLASQEPESHQALKTWLQDFDLPELESPVSALLDGLALSPRPVFAKGLRDAATADEKCLACALCGCTVDTDHAMLTLGQRFDSGVMEQIALPLQAIALLLNQHGARLRQAWGRRIQGSTDPFLQLQPC
ncbi:MAG: hypothetical protein AAGJ52_05780 [Pseudomonadota bacterium]